MRPPTLITKIIEVDMCLIRHKEIYTNESDS
jgi:hypothetical protein